MSSQITLSASMRSNLLSLQGTQKLMDITQERLSTGKKINSALDNPSSYFTAQSLNNRAGELEGLLDGMGQAVQALKAADEGLTSLKNFVEQAKSLANNARDTSNYQSTIFGTTEVKNVGSPQEFSIATGDTFTVRTGSSVEIIGTRTTSMTQTLASAGVVSNNGTSDAIIAIKVGNNDFVKVTIPGSAISSTTVEDLAKRINSNTSLNKAVTVSVENNRLVIKSTDPQASVTVKDLNEDGTVRDNGGIAAAFGMDRGTVITIPATNAAVVTGATKVVSANTVASYGISPTPATFQIIAGPYTQNITIPSAGTTIADVVNMINNTTPRDVTAAISTTAPNSGSLTITCNTVGRSVSIKDLGDSNVASKLGIKTNGFIAPSQGNFEDLIKQIQAVNDSISVEIDRDGKLKISMTNGDDIVIADLSGSASTVLGISGTGMDGTNVRKSYSEQFNTILDQINDLILNNDSSYKGTNLLNGQDLTVYFNEYRTSNLKIQSVVFDTQGLGLKDSQNEWKNNSDIEQALIQVDGAVSMIEAQASEFGQNLSAIQNRQDFTDNMVNILTTGADNLVLADMNEEAANMLSLQVRQELGTNALSLASQAQQSVLKLF